VRKKIMPFESTASRALTWKKKYEDYARQHAVGGVAHISREASPPKMPDRGHGISAYLDRLAGHYTAYFISRAHAIRAAQYLANATREGVDLVAIQDHGNLRHVVGEVTPDPFDKFRG
jgi:hypothetical protein